MSSSSHLMAPASSPSPPLNSSTSSLEPPNAPFAARQGSASSSSSSRPPSVAGSVTSLAHNYLPAKFSSSLVTRRKPKGARSSGKGVPRIPGFARGGGVDAFGAGADRIPGERDEDEDDWGGRSRSLFAGVGRAGKRVRWTRFKVILFAANLVLISYALASLITLLLVYFRVFRVSAVLLTANSTELLLSTLASSFLCFVGLLGFPGILLNNRPFLAVYTFFLWIGFGLMVVPGYLAYKRRNLNLDGKINQQWSRELGAEDRLIIQGALQCCGYFSPFVEATLSATCYSRSVLPGCKSQFLAFERLALERFYTFSFGLVPVHIGVIVCALLCSNHVTYRFGKGMMPRAYRLKQEDVALIVDRYARHVSRHTIHGSGRLVSPIPAAAALVRTCLIKTVSHSKDPWSSSGTSANASSTDVHLKTMATMPYSPREASGSSWARTENAKYDSLGGKTSPGR
ncbi:unnamed protein product [Mycena citricolor]|uniref:Tetraspanin Tsp2 n=1 Tax=Mycena citricolor TaxID=2018698 RepID=A0AAD2H8K6_9AGAR|nr:unnamed protein product [Mycena citricolor]